MAEYQYILDPFTGKNATGVLRTADNAFVPADAANVDWQQFQLWLDEGGTPDPAPEPPPSPPDPLTTALAERDALAERLAAIEAKLGLRK